MNNVVYRYRRKVALVHFDIVQGCQLRCVGCPNSTLHPKVERIEVPVFERCLSNLDVRLIRLFRIYNFGEPLLHHDLPGILSAIRRQSWDLWLVELSTNGQQVKWDQLEEVIRHGLLNVLWVSCDGNGTKEDYERLRPPSKWERLIEFLRRVVELRDRYAPNMLLCSRSSIQTTESKEVWEKLIPEGWKKEFRPYFALPDNQINMTGKPVVQGNGVCWPMSGNSFLFFNGYGQMVPCCAHPQAGILGDLREQKLSEIMRGDQRRRFLDAMMNNRESLSVCRQCPQGEIEIDGPRRT